MKLNKFAVRIIAVLAAAVMTVSLAGCISSYNSNPIVAKVGSVKLDLSQYLSLYNNTDSSSNMYYTYLQYGLITRQQYAEYILEELVNYGVQIDQLDVQKITLDAEEEAKLQNDVDEQVKSYVNSNYLSKVDSSITDETAKYEAALELFKADLKANGTNFDKYRASVEENLRQTARLKKLHELTVANVAVTNDDVKTYVSTTTNTSVTVSNFNSSWQNLLGLTSKAAPLFMPHPEKAVEDDPETTDKDEAKDADPMQEIFSVLHLLIKFSTTADSTVTDLEEYAGKDEEFTKKMNDFEEILPGLTAEEFLAKCYDKETCDDPGMQNPSYQYFGYLMQESIISSYYSGFGYAAMKLRFGDEWQSEKEKNADTTGTAENAGEPEYNVTMFELADGTQIAKVLTTAGVHYIIINTNECFNMYDEDGYLMLPLYDGDELVTDDEGIVTVHDRHMTQEQLDAINETLSNIKATPTETEEGGDAEDDETEAVTLKSIYEYYRTTKLESMQSEVYNNMFNEWKKNTKIVKKTNVIKSFYQG